MTFSAVLAWLLGGIFLTGCFAVGYFVLATRKIAAAAERAVPPAGTFIDIDGDRIHYVETGEGRPILFLHGLGGQLHHFRHPLFHRFGPGYRLIAVDRPGSGYSVRANGRSGSLIEQAQFVRRFIETIGLDRPLVVGHSLGGAVALATAIEHPGSISGIALIAPPTRMEPEIRREFAGLAIRSPMRRWAIANTIAIPASLKYAPQTLAFVFGPQTAGKDYIIEGGGYAGLRPSHFYATSTDFVALEDVLGRLEERYGEIDMPAGLIFGTEDRVLDYRIHGLPMSARIAGLDFELLDGMGHMLQFVAPDRTLSFIERVAARAFADRR